MAGFRFIRPFTVTSKVSDDGFFNEHVAASYDLDEEDSSPEVVTPIVDLLESFSTGSEVLEFGIGTGRVACPLAARGVPVHGIDISNAMMKRITGKPGADLVTTTTGDFSSTAVSREFNLVFLVFNTIMNLTTQQAQVDCFHNAARHLKPGGHFIIEVITPRLQSIPPGERFHTFAFSETHWGIEEYDIATQTSHSHHMNVRDGVPEILSMPFRYVWPSELDLMAKLAGMDLVHRWQDWDKSPFVNESQQHVSVWQKPQESGDE